MKMIKQINIHYSKLYDDLKQLKLYESPQTILKAKIPTLKETLKYKH